MSKAQTMPDDYFNPFDAVDDARRAAALAALFVQLVIDGGAHHDGELRALHRELRALRGHAYALDVWGAYSREHPPDNDGS